MKWMGWSYQQLEACPADLIPVVADLMEKEAESNRRANRKR